MTKKKKLIIILASILAVVLITVAFFGNTIMNAVIGNTLGRDLPQLTGEPEVGK